MNYLLNIFIIFSITHHTLQQMFSFFVVVIFRMLSFWQTSPSKVSIFSQRQTTSLSARDGWRRCLCLCECHLFAFLNPYHCLLELLLKTIFLTLNVFCPLIFIFVHIFSIWMCLIGMSHGRPLPWFLQFRGAVCFSLNYKSFPLWPNTKYVVYPSEIKELFI